MRWLGLLLISACCTTPYQPLIRCITPCGMTSATEFCEELSEFEGQAVTRFGKVPDWTEAEVCNALHGWRIVEVPPAGPAVCRNGWLEGSICVVGYTRIFTGVMAVLGPGIRKDILAHEMVHVIDYRMRGYPGHCDWHTRGIAEALKDITGEEDDSAGTGCPDPQP